MANFVIPTPFFENKYKRLAKKFPSLDIELINLEKELINNPKLGESLGSNLYKIRVNIQLGYPDLEIRSPIDLMRYENE